MNACPSCHGPMRKSLEDFDYTKMAGGVRVMLRKVEILRCTGCDESEVVIPRILELHRLIATDIAQVPRRLTPAEVRFLRKWLKRTGLELAALCRVTPATVSRWENGRTPIGSTAEQLLRLLVLSSDPAGRLGLADLPLTITKARPKALDLRPAAKGWKAA